MSTAIWALAVSTPSQRPLATCPRYLPAPLPSLPDMVRGRGQPAARGKGAKGGKGYHQKGAKGVCGRLRVPVALPATPASTATSD